MPLWNRLFAGAAGVLVSIPGLAMLGLAADLEIIEDPIYLAEPWILSRSFQLSATPQPPIGPPCVTAYEGSVAPTAPHYLPEKNPFVDEMTTKYGVPRDAAIGKPETLYPEYRKKIPPLAPVR